MEGEERRRGRKPCEPAQRPGYQPEQARLASAKEHGLESSTGAQPKLSVYGMQAGRVLVTVGRDDASALGLSVRLWDAGRLGPGLTPAPLRSAKVAASPPKQVQK